MELMHMDRDKVIKLKPVTEYELNYTEGLDQLITLFGPVLPVIINRSTWKILNPVILQAYQKCVTLAQIPVVLIEVPRHQEIIVSIAINGGLDHFLTPVPTDTNNVLTDLLNASEEELATIAPLEYIGEIFAMYAGDDLDTEEDDQDPEPVNDQVTTDYSRTSDYGIPELDPAHQATAPPESSQWVAYTLWEPTAPKPAMHFYIDDAKFRALEKTPEKILKYKPEYVIECNYSTNPDKPEALILADIYKKRMIARIWQRHGIKIAVDMNVNREFFDLNLLGVPAGWKVYANRGYVEDLRHLEDAYQVAQDHAGTEDIIYIVYGRQTVRKMCESNNWHWIDSSLHTFGQ